MSGHGSTALKKPPELIFAAAESFGLHPALLGALLIVIGAGLVVHGRARLRRSHRPDWWKSSSLLTTLFTSRYSLLSVRLVPYPGWARERPDVFFEIFYGAAFIVAGIGGILFFPQ